MQVLDAVFVPKQLQKYSLGQARRETEFSESVKSNNHAL